MSTDYEMAWQDADEYCKDVSENSALVEILSVEVTLNYFSVDYSFIFFFQQMDYLGILLKTLEIQVNIYFSFFSKWFSLLPDLTSDYL